MPPLSSYTITLPQEVMLGTGILVQRGFDNTGLTPIGVTEGGLTFDAAREIRNIPFDGKLFDIEGLDWETGGIPSIAGTFKQLGAPQIPVFETAAASAAGADHVTTVYTPRAAGTLFTAGDYINNLCLIWGRVSGGYVQVRFFRALCTQYRIIGRDKQEVNIEATFLARQTAAASATDLGTKPFLIEELSALS